MRLVTTGGTPAARRRASRIRLSLPGGWQPEPQAADPATRLLARIVTVFAAAMRLGIGVAMAAAALLGAVPPVRTSLLLVVSITGLAWSVLFAWVVLRRGLVWWMVTTEIVVAVALCAGVRWLVPAEALTAGTAWVAPVASVSIVVAHLAWRPPAAITAGLAVIGAYLAGSAGVMTGGDQAVQAATFLVQTIVAGVLMWLLRRAGRIADTALAAYHDTRRDAEVARLRRAAEREHNQHLHDTVLATLTMVGTGSISTSNPALREQAGRDLAVVRGVPAVTTMEARGPVRLDQRLREAVAQRRRHLSVTTSLDECTVPATVADALAGACGQALANVADHARTDQARVRLVVDGQGVRVDVFDDGVGFDRSAVPAHRLGIREAIVGRVRSVGGQAEVESRPGNGTRVWLRWDHG